MAQANEMFRSLIFNFNIMPNSGIMNTLFMIIFITWFMVLIQIVEFVKKDLLYVIKSPVYVRVAVYVICFYLMVLYGVRGSSEFIYFQF